MADGFRGDRSKRTFHIALPLEVLSYDLNPRHYPPCLSRRLFDLRGAFRKFALVLWTAGIFAGVNKKAAGKGEC